MKGQLLKFILGFIAVATLSEINAQWDNPLVYYQFNEVSGSMAADSSGNGFGGEINCEDCWETEGRYDGALHFKGSQKVDLPADDMALTNKEGTVAFWAMMAPSSASTINCMWWAGENGGDTFGPQNEMHINSEATETNIWVGGEIAFYIHDSLANNRYFIFSDTSKGPDPATPPSPNAITLTDGIWHHIACTWDSGGTVALYIDGRAIWDTTAYNPNPWECHIMTIGAANERSNRRLNGMLDEFRIYNVALEAIDIETIYNYDPAGTVPTANRNRQTGRRLLNCFPNPAGRSIYFHNSVGIESVEICSLTGVTLKTETVPGTNDRVEIDLGHISPGVYFIRAYRKDRLVSMDKFIKK